MADPKPRRHRSAPSAVGYALLAAGAFLCLFEGLGRWVGAATMLTALPELGLFTERGPRWSRLVAALPYILVTLVAATLLGDLMVGHPPASRDHGIHYFQTRLFVDDFITHGRFSGWTDHLNNGYPFGESYPTLGYALTSAAHLVSFGAIGLRTSYAWGILMVWGIGTVAVWWLAAALARPLLRNHASAAWAGAAAAVLFLFDAGASRQGGWAYTMFHGVWPQLLSASLWVLSMPLTHRALSRPSARRIALAGGVLGASVLAHPFGIIAAATSGLGWLIALALARPEDELSSGRFTIWAIVHGIGAALCAGWVVTFLGSADSMAREPVPWVPLGALAIELVRGALLSSQLLWMGPLALIGVVAVVRRGRPLGLLVFGVASALLLLGSHAAITVLRLDLLVASFKNLQFPRYAIELKPLLFSLGGVGAWLLPAVLLRDRSRGNEPRLASSRRRRFVLALVAAPLLVAGVEDAGRLAARPVGALDTLESSTQHGPEQELLAALRAEANSSEGAPIRVAFLREAMGGGTYPIFAITDCGADLVLDSHIPTVNFKHRVVRRVRALEELAVTHVVFDHDIPPSEDDLAVRLEEIGSFGPYRVARFDGSQQMQHARVHRGGGTASVESASPESWDIRVEADVYPARIILARPPHIRWQAALEGAPLDVELVRNVPGLSQMAIEVPTAGVVQLRYRRSTLETVADWVSWLTLVGVLLALTRRHPLPFADRVFAPRVRHVYAAVGLVAAVAVIGVFSRRQSTQLDRTWSEAVAEIEKRTAPPRFERDLVVEDAIHVSMEPARVCDGLLGKSTLPGCSEALHRPALSMVHRDPYLYRCLEVTVPPGGSTTLQFSAPRHAVYGLLERFTAQGRGKGLTYDVAGKPRRVGKGLRTFTIDTDGAPTLRLDNTGTIPERVCVAAAAFAP